jgi:hypothetical protein
VGTTALTFQDVTQGYAPINSPALLGAPTALTPPQFDSSLRLVNTAFAKRMGVEYSGFAPLTASTVLGASSVGGMVSAASAVPINITLPPTAGVPDGATVGVVSAGTGAVTILPSGLDVETSPVGGVITFVLGAGDNAEFVKVAGGWRLRGGSMALRYASVITGPNWFTQPMFTADKSWATTEFVQRALGNLSGMTIYTGNSSMSVTDFGRIVLANSALSITLTLPAVGSVPTGASIHIRNVGSAPATVVPPAGGSMSVIATISIPSVVLQPGASLMATVQGSNYFLDGSASLKHGTDFSASLTGPICWQKLPSGDIEQWGTYVGAASGAEVVITLPVTMLAPPTGIELTYANFSSSEVVGQAPVLQARASTVGSITIRNLWSNTASFMWKVRGRV